jgi:DNA-directed RNA polymerase specialized sigma24 family protein
MTPDEYARAVRVARRACASQRPYLSREDWEDVCQEAALAAWAGRHVFWAAFDEATRLQGGRRKVQPTILYLAEMTTPQGDPMELRGSDDVEAEVVAQLTTEWLLGHLPYAHRQAVELIDIADRPWVEVEATLGVPDGTIARRRVRGLERLRELVST